MSEIKCPNCGVAMRSSDLKCSLCGYKRKLNFALSGVGDEAIPEAPVEAWEEQLNKKKTYSDESLKEVKEEFEQRNNSKNSKTGSSFNLQSQYDDSPSTSSASLEMHRSRRRRSPISYLITLVSLVSIVYAIYQYSGISVNGYKSANRLEIGNCVRDMNVPSGESENSVGSVKTLECSLNHKWEVFYKGTITSDLNSRAERVEYVGNQCDEQKANYLTQLTGAGAVSFADASLQYIFPSDGSWAEGDRLFTCMAGDDNKIYKSSFIN